MSTPEAGVWSMLITSGIAFRRQDLLAIMPAGLHTLRIEGLASGQLFVGIREISVVR